MIQLVPGGRLRMWSLQLVLRRTWDHCVQSALVSWTPEIRLDLEWWLARSRLGARISLAQVFSAGTGSLFRPLVTRGSGVVHKRQGDLGHGIRSSVLCSADFKLHGGVI